MASVLNRTTKEYLRSVNTPDYPETDWIRNPDLSAVEGWPAKYWIITGDVVSLMSEAQRATVDAAELEASRDLVAAQLDQMEDVLRALMLGILDQLNAHALKHNAILDAIDGATNLASLQTRIAAISDFPQYTPAQVKAAVRAKLGS